jgi:hypothetical protein
MDIEIGSGDNSGNGNNHVITKVAEGNMGPAAEAMSAEGTISGSCSGDGNGDSSGVASPTLPSAPTPSPVHTSLVVAGDIGPAAEATGADDDGNYCSGSGECEGMLLCCTMLYTHSFIYT